MCNEVLDAVYSVYKFQTKVPFLASCFQASQSVAGVVIVDGPHPQSMMVSLPVAEVFASHPERSVLESIVVAAVKSFLCSIGVVSVVLFVLVLGCIVSTGLSG